METDLTNFLQALGMETFQGEIMQLTGLQSLEDLRCFCTGDDLAPLLQRGMTCPQLRKLLHHLNLSSQSNEQPAGPKSQSLRLKDDYWIDDCWIDDTPSFPHKPSMADSQKEHQASSSYEDPANYIDSPSVNRI